MGPSMSKWDNNFLSLANTVSMFSKDPSTKVGAVITDDDNRVISIGYNGFPKGIKDDERLEVRDLKYDMVVHAEANALLFANSSTKGCTIYTWPFMPCSRCASLLIQAGISRVVSAENNEPRWQKNFRLSQEMFSEARVVCQLFKNPATWRFGNI
jgi:dCMP deaminase